MTTLPALSTPCTWNTFLARSTPMVLICMWTPPLVIRCSTITLWHIRCRERASSTTSFASVWPDYGDFRSTPVNGHSQDGRAFLKGARHRHQGEANEAAN